MPTSTEATMARRIKCKGPRSNDETQCGIGFWKPRWIQPLASKYVYMLVFGILGFNEAACGSYFYGTVTSIEKRFKLPTIFSGTLSSVFDSGAILPLIILAYCGGSKHKTRWVALCTTITALACFLMTFPHYIFGPGDKTNFENTKNSQDHLCNKEESATEYCDLNSEGLNAFFMFSFSQFAMGIGSSTYATLAAAYLDDNVAKDEFPIAFCISSFINSIGPTFGFIVSWYAMSIFLVPSVEPPFDEKDSRWIGSWHKGWIGFGIFELIIGISMSLFPKILPQEAERRAVNPKRRKEYENTKKLSLRDFKETVLRISKNPVIIYGVLNSVFHTFGTTTFRVFLAKYIETQFGQSASAASMYTGCVGVFSIALGILLSGLCISKFKPGPRFLVGWSICVHIIEVIGVLGYTFLSCYKNDLHGAYAIDHTWNLTASCNAGCNCGSQISYTPVCSTNGIQSTTFFSPCHAGCTGSLEIKGIKTFTNCSCSATEVIDGACPLDCLNQFHTFLILLFAIRFLSATTIGGNTMVKFRAVKPEDKAITIAFASVTSAIMVHIPAPVLFGLLFDTTCLVWGSVCGSEGNCLLYHGNDLRDLLNYTTIGFLFCAILFQICLVNNVGNLVMYDEANDINENENNVDECLEITEMAELTKS